MGDITRRGFIGGASVLAIGALGTLAACSSETPQKSTEGTSPEASNDKAPAAAEVIDCDIVVVGAGGSGLAATVEAAEQGAKVICVESQEIPGGNENIVEGIFAVSSSMQKAENLTFDTGGIVRRELEQGQYRASGPSFVSMIDASGANVDWLIDHGVKFWRVDADHGTERFFHRFEDTTGSVGYVPPMVEAAQKAGAEIMYQTHGDSLIVNGDGSIGGLYATKADGSVIQINSKAVIIATGGFANNDEYMSEMGYNVETMNNMGMPGHDGAGHTMAVDAGAMSNLTNSGAIADLSLPGLPLFFDGGKFNPYYFSKYPRSLWLNEEGERFLNEDFALENMMFPPVAATFKKQIYVFSDQAILDAWMSGEATKEVPELNAGIDRGGISAEEELSQGLDKKVIFQADTLEELESKVGFPTGALQKSIDRYNASVAAGSDKDFGKDPKYLREIGPGPYYLMLPAPTICAPIGSIKTNRNFNAIDENEEPIKGLYVVGVEGAMMWANVYTVNISGGANANNVHSGRTAAQHAITTLL